jgi:hypothetical protein
MQIVQDKMVVLLHTPLVHILLVLVMAIIQLMMIKLMMKINLILRQA